MILKGILTGRVNSLNSSLDLYQPFADLPFGEIYKQNICGQYFVCKQNFLYRVDFFLATYGRKNTKDIVFHLRQGTSKNDVATVVVNASSIKDHAWQEFEFPPIENSAGKVYYALLESPDSEPGNAVTALMTRRRVYLDAESVLDDQQGSITLKFRTYCLSSNRFDYLPRSEK